jgi:hypothetical protein
MNLLKMHERNKKDTFSYPAIVAVASCCSLHQGIQGGIFGLRYMQ